MFVMGKYAGKKAVITGGTHGIGLAVVRALLDGGAEVLLTGRNEKNIEAVRTELAGLPAHVVRSDAGSMADIRALGGIVEEKLGRIDFLFVNVGHAELGMLEEVTEEAFDKSFDINTKGAFFTTQALAPLVNDGGSIVFTTAVLVGHGYPGTGVATGMKAAVGGFAKVFAAELLSRKIRVNAVSPGFTLTPTMGYANMTEEEKAANEKEGAQLTPLGRHAEPEEIAAAVLYLGFDATFSTGTVLHADGGMGQGIPPLFE
ncbi:SDR family oxidoreductase [Streptomyces gulbargensis]|uniref:SDR family oxidoreductase n=2 Tax=Streptomyces TaxID=1883 RepID=A0ABP7NCJ3_9ACTN